MLTRQQITQIVNMMINRERGYSDNSKAIEAMLEKATAEQRVEIYNRVSNSN